MLILHTSDLHLCEDRPETLKALQKILETAREHKVDLLTIGGDLFHSERDAEALRSKLRREFSENPFKIIAIPGNHDKEAYSVNLDFGPDLIITHKEPYEIHTYNEVSIIAIPYRERPSEQLLNELKNAAKDTKTRILLLHCTLDIGFTSQDFGEETTKFYFPVTAETLSRLEYHYVLAGHFHAQTYIRSLNGKGCLIYPGSPVSYTKKEKGKRQAVLIDTEKGDVTGIFLGSFYYDYAQFYVKPGKEDETLQEVKKWITDRSGDDCALEAAIKGFVKISEKEFREALDSIMKNGKILHDYRNIERVLAHPLYHRFFEKLQADEEIENKDKAEAFVINAMSRLLADRRLRE